MEKKLFVIAMHLHKSCRWQVEVLKDSCFQDSGFTGESSLHFGPHLIFVPFIEPHATWKWKISTESNGLSRWIILGSTWFINPTWKLFKGGNYSRVETIRGNTVYDTHLSTAVVWREKICKHFVFISFVFISFFFGGGTT